MRPGRRVIRVVIVNDHPVARQGARHILDSSPGFKVVAEAGSPEEALQILQATFCDVLVTDLIMPSGREPDGIYFVKKLSEHRPAMGIVVLTGAFNQALLSALLNETEVTLIDKGAPISEMLRAVKAAAQGGRYISAGIQRILTRAEHGGSVSDRRPLSVRELEVLRLHVQGLPNHRIATLFGTSEKTVSNQKRSAMQKLQCSSVVDLVAAAARLGICDGA